MSYIGNQPVIQSTEFREEYFPTASQTAFVTGGFHPSAVSVTRNGVLLSESDYTKGTDNVTITLNSAAISGDVVVIRGNRSLVQGVAVSESRVEYTWQSGDTAVQLNADVVPFYSDVYLNGVKLAAADYTINTVNRTVSFTSAPAVGDVIAVVHRNETSSLVGLPIKDSYGNEVLSQSGNTVTLANVDNVGIGTSSPDRPLHVTRSDGTGTVVKVGNTGATASTIEFANTASTDTISIGAENNDLVLKSDDGDIFLNTTGDPATASMIIERGGNVGIGTSSPGGKLQINNGSTSLFRVTSSLIDGSILNAKITKTSGNADDFKTPGFYRFDPAVSNTPSSSYHHAVIVFGNGNNVTSQIAVRIASTISYVRSFNTSWTSWQRLDT